MRHTRSKGSRADVDGISSIPCRVEMHHKRIRNVRETFFGLNTRLECHPHFYGSLSVWENS